VSATRLPDPFFVLATQNPIEQEGTYPLPEAQLDRFMFNIKVDYPTATPSSSSPC
jgi:MoxR-like ATPase